jgi:hypothetical protein
VVGGGVDPTVGLIGNLFDLAGVGFFGQGFFYKHLTPPGSGSVKAMFPIIRVKIENVIMFYLSKNEIRIRVFLGSKLRRSEIFVKKIHQESNPVGVTSYIRRLIKKTVYP